jgi:hypothetical protein
MIRKMLVIAAAVAMPASALAAVTTIGTSGVAGAVKVYTSQSCAITGGVTFAAPGLSHDGTLGKKSTATSVSSATATGAGCGAGASGFTFIKNKITTAATDCNVAPTPPATNPVVCASATTKMHYAFSNASNLASAGVSSIVASLSKGLKVYDNGNKAIAAVTAGGTSSVVGGACGAGHIGFQLSGNTSVTGLTYNLLLCFAGDTGTAITNDFFADYLAAAGGNTGITIATAVYGGNSALTFVKV